MAYRQVEGVVVTVTLNMRAKAFALRELFMMEPPERFPTASVSVADLALTFCSYDGCGDDAACRKHGRAMVLGVSKMIVAGELFAEMSRGGVLFVRLSPEGVLSPLLWSSVPGWFSERPGLVKWAESELLRRKWEARV